MRILVNLLSFTGTKGGMEVYTRELYTELGRMETGHEFVGYASTEFMKRDHSWFPGPVFDSGFSGENRYAWAFAELFMVSIAARRHKVDLIHSPATIGPWRSHVPAVYTMHDMLYFRAPELMATPRYTEPMKWIEKRAASNATWIITDSIASAEDIERFLGFPEDRIEVVYLAGTATTSTQSVVGREPDLFIAVGNRLPHKNLEGVVRSIAHIPASKRPRLVVTGSRGDDPLLPIVEELDLAGSVDLREWVPDEEIEWLYEHATALIVANFCDGFGLPIHEAMHNGLPVLLSDIPVYHEVSGGHAQFFDTTDPRLIAATIESAMSDPVALESAAIAAREFVSTFSWHKTAVETLSVFDRAIAEPTRAKFRCRRRLIASR